jgi:gliding motility-associated-like protein
VLDVIDDTSICAGNSILLGTTATSGVSYSWTATPADPSLTDPSSSVASVSPTQTTTYELTAIGANGCQSIETVTVSVVDPVVTVNDAVDICPGEMATLTATVSPSGGTVTWLDWENNVVGSGVEIQVSPEASGSYFAQYQIGDCIVTAVAQVNVASPVTLDISATPGVNIIAGEETTLTVTGAPAGSTFVWTTDNGSAAPSGGNPTVSPTETTGYTVEVTTPDGCVYEAYITIFVEYLEFDIPNVFTPNGDGLNDDFYPIYNEFSMEIIELKIFARWGAIVYDNPGTPWDGIYRSKPLPSDIYVYLIRVRYADGREELFKGDVNLMR